MSSEVRCEIVNDFECINDVVDIHMQSFEGFFLTFLGKGFLKTLYRGFVNHDKSALIVAFDNGQPVGFCAYSEDLSGFYKYLIKKKLLKFAWYAAGAFFRKPKIMIRLLRAFKYSGESKRDDLYIELSSIGVLPTENGKGIGSKLISTLYSVVDKNSFDYIKLETDKENNVIANNFYVKNGFSLVNEYETPEGRKMNEYRLFLKEGCK